MREQQQAEFDALVTSRAPALHRTAYLLVGDWALAQDLVQTALATTWAHWDRLTDPAAGEAYTRRVMARTASAWWRRRWRGETPAAALPERPGVVDRYAESDQRAVLLAALARLPARQRAVVVLRFYEDLSEAAVAELLGCSLGTVKSSCARALARLRELHSTNVSGRPR